MKRCEVNVSCSDNIQANLHVKTWVGVFFVESYIKDMSHRMVTVMDTGSNLLWVHCIPCPNCAQASIRIYNLSTSSTHVSGHIDDSAFASLTVWNMKTWKAMTVLPLGEDPPAITSLCFNHNGKILAASATDGMIHMFDMSAGLQITGWPAHDCGISSILFGADETSIFSLGTDGKVLEWSLQKQGHVLWSINSKSSSHLRHEMALDANGRRLLVNSGSVRAPIYQTRSRASGLRTLPHSASVTTVDWYPTLPIFLTGSADNSVRVTSIL
ncbi:uncharacterized protein LOC130135331 isoform X3 [Syzygium oleosum]|nr:uncharacterized protein LOC130135331 isoform X3 [Syzygium oleosum]